MDVVSIHLLSVPVHHERHCTFYKNVQDNIMGSKILKTGPEQSTKDSCGPESEVSIKE